MAKSLAVKYRPHQWSDVTEQSSVKTILQNQLETGEIKNAYIFVGSAGCGKTTCARIFANEINKCKGNPIELDAASNNSVDDVRNIAKMAQTKSIESEYKVFILDEVHMFSAGAWSAMLKLIEEPPAKSVFIMCTTDYWKIPKTILSRSQRYTFNRISTDGIIHRLLTILKSEYPSSTGPNDIGISVDIGAVEFIARMSDGGMRDAITTLDKCLAYSEELTLENVVKALGTSSYEIFKSLTDAVSSNNVPKIFSIIEEVFATGEDMKQFVKNYLDFVMDICKYDVTNSFKFTHLPSTDDMKAWLDETVSSQDYYVSIATILKTLVQIDVEIKWSQSPKNVLEARLVTLKG